MAQMAFTHAKSRMPRWGVTKAPVKRTSASVRSIRHVTAASSNRTTPREEIDDGLRLLNEEQNANEAARAFTRALSTFFLSIFPSISPFSQQEHMHYESTKKKKKRTKKNKRQILTFAQRKKVRHERRKGQRPTTEPAPSPGWEESTRPLTTSDRQ